jgi:hypothetical protein
MRLSTDRAEDRFGRSLASTAAVAVTVAVLGLYAL